MVFKEPTTLTVTQKQFLPNNRNKDRLIIMLTEKIKREGFSAKQTKEDADHLMVTTAIRAAQNHECVVLEEKTDLLFMVTA